MSHHQDEAAKLERLHKINEYHFQQFAYLVKKLAATPEGDGTMLDYTMLLYGTGISDSNTHFHDDLPIALVGGQAAGLSGGRYVRHPKGTPLTNLYVTILESLGVPVEKFGDSTGTLSTLTDGALTPADFVGLSPGSLDPVSSQLSALSFRLSALGSQSSALN